MSDFENKHFMPIKNNQRNIYQPPGKKNRENNEQYKPENNRFLNPRSRGYENRRYGNTRSSVEREKYNRNDNFNERKRFSKEKSQEKVVIDTTNMQEFPGLGGGNVNRPNKSNNNINNYSNAANLSFTQAMNNSKNNSLPEPEKPRKFVSLVNKKKKTFVEEEDYEIDIELENNYLNTTYFSEEEEEKPDTFKEEYY